MTARIISAAEAQAMLEAGRLEQGPRLNLLLSAPDLAASVVALHAEVERAAAAERTRIAAWLKERADKAYSAGIEHFGDALLNASRILETEKVTP